MSNHHVAVWIDHHEAKIFHLDEASFETTSVLAPRSHVRRRSEPTVEHAHPADAQRFYHDVAHALEGADEILVTGPATAKLELIKHIHAHDRALEPKVIGVETVDHPTDGQLVHYARRYFRAADRMR